VSARSPEAEPVTARPSEAEAAAEAVWTVTVPGPLPTRLDELVPPLEAAGCRVLRPPVPAAGEAFAWTDDEVARWIVPADALVGIFAGMRLDRAVLERAERVRVVTSPIIGTEHIDVAACTELGIVVAFGAVPENIDGVAEAVVMLIAALRKQLPAKSAAVRDGGWRVPFAGNMVRGSTVGLVGLGAIGRATAARLAGWDATLVGTDPFVSPAAAAEAGVELVGLDDLLARADVVSLAVTLSPETHHLIGARELALMKPGSYLINTARGGVVDEEALLAALEDGHLAGAALDTWEAEGPGGSSPLRTHPQVIATGHNVGHSEELYDTHPRVAAESTLLALGGEPPRYVRNPEVLPAWRERCARLDAAAAAATSR